MMIGNGQVTALRRASKWPSSNQRRKDADRYRREVRSGVKTWTNRVAGKRALHNRVQVSVSATSHEVSTQAVFGLRLSSLGTECLRVHGGSELRCPEE